MRGALGASPARIVRHCSSRGWRSRSLDPPPDLMIDTMDALVADSVAQPRFSMLLIGSFAALASTSTLVGLYGTVAYLVAAAARDRHPPRPGCQSWRHPPDGVAAGRSLDRRRGCGGRSRRAGDIARLALVLLVDLGSADPLLVGLAAPLLTIASLAAVPVPAQGAAAVEPGIALRLG